MNTERLPFIGRILIFLLIFAMIAASFTYLAQKYNSPSQAAQQSEAVSPIRCVVLDAGHGGEDGGAVSASGLVEKDINLQLTLLLRDLLVANGVEVIMTRDTDTLLYDRTVDYHGRKKALDLAARKKIAEETPNSVFVSIHMNTYPLPTCRGLQVWYSPNNKSSFEIAQQIQSTARSLLQPENDRQVKAAGSSIYLLHHLQTPAVLIECGFLSTPEEAERLADTEYQRMLAFTVFLALMQSEIPVTES
ncbi:MAG: N-acetylmuramoyl-L-alanine amidase [Clostridia bacterium]|nr:N-acetylmuramoyl-L-alanine amidase [Clostridia bacterium]